MIDDNEIDALREIASRIRSQAEEACYGAFHGGDPRDFTPDAESCTAEEMERWKADCASWENGQPIDRGSSHVALDADTGGIEAVCHVVYEGGDGHKTMHWYGLGVMTYRDEDILRIAQDLDDVIDRIRQVAT